MFWWCLQKYRRTRQIEATRSGSTNSTSKIDSVARIVFPLSFGLFNITYWYSYFQAQKPFDWDDHMLKGQFHEKNIYIKIKISNAAKAGKACRVRVFHWLKNIQEKWMLMFCFLTGRHFTCYTSSNFDIWIFYLLYMVND